MHNQRSGLANSLLNWPIGVCSDINKDEPGRIIDCYTYALFNLNLFFFFEQKFDNEYDRGCVRMLWTHLVPNEFHISICKNGNFIVLNKLS